jgi:holo-[acyl-carrier protein] synthase
LNAALLSEALLNTTLYDKNQGQIAKYKLRINNNVMIVGTGVDIAEVPRIRETIERFGDRFLRRIFTEGEIRYCERKARRFESYAARFAAKEAGMKALGTGWSRGVRWRDIEVVRPKGQRPTIQFHGEAAAIAATLGTKNVALSITHTSEEALAHVILEN